MMRWCCKMAWRDSRTHRRKLLLFTASITIGIGALAGMGSLEVEGERPVNSFWLLGAVLGGQTVLLAIWLLLLLFSSSAPPPSPKSCSRTDFSSRESPMMINPFVYKQFRSLFLRSLFV